MATYDLGWGQGLDSLEGLKAHLYSRLDSVYRVNPNNLLLRQALADSVFQINTRATKVKPDSAAEDRNAQLLQAQGYGYDRFTQTWHLRDDLDRDSLANAWRVQDSLERAGTDLETGKDWDLERWGREVLRSYGCPVSLAAKITRDHSPAEPRTLRVGDTVCRLLAARGIPEHRYRVTTMSAQTESWYYSTDAFWLRWNGRTWIVTEAVVKR